MKIIDYIINICKKVCVLVWEQLPLYATLLFLQATSIFVIYYLSGLLGAGLFLGAIAWSYIQILPLLFLSVKASKFYIAIIIAINYLLSTFQLFCAIKFEELVYSTHIQLLVNTNREEASEFLSTFVDFKSILIIVALLIASALIFKLMLLVKKKSVLKIFTYPLTAISIFSLITTTYFGIWSDCGIGRSVYSIFSLKDYKSYDLITTQADFIVYETTSSHPNIILIVGESFDRNHSSLYGYSKDTNPRLYKRATDSTLVVFTSVQSSAPITNLSFRQMFSLSEHLEDNMWHEKAMLPTALNKGGYYSQWISNQTANSVFDNVLGQIANLYDKRIYTSNEYMAGKSRYDEVILEPFKHYINKSQHIDKIFCTVHLMGSHANYYLRYPDNYSKFHNEDYLDQPEHRRSTFATYDNSIFYNDFIVDSIMSICDNIDALVIYLADHGQDFYYTRDMAIHGRIGDPESFRMGCQIPFMIYLTDKYRQKHPDMIEILSKYKDNAFETKYLMNTILDIAGYDIIGDCTHENSLFKGQFNSF
ncbi:MAG: phosphoethanolamine transferase [Muribaculaceae bacterium]|nr:phosphoethanolamine transferase [Muribaculaceae bacterium]